MTDILVRPITPADYPFLKSAWLKHYKDHSDFARPIRNSVYFPAHSRIVDGILARPNAKALIAVHPDEPTVILGFLVSDQPMGIPTIHYLYVIEKARRMGIGRELMRGAKLTTAVNYTHRTVDAKALATKYPDLTYNPYLI